MSYMYNFQLKDEKAPLCVERNVSKSAIWSLQKQLYEIKKCIKKCAIWR